MMRLADEFDTVRECVGRTDGQTITAKYRVMQSAARLHREIRSLTGNLNYK